MEQYNQPPMALGPAKTPSDLRKLMMVNNAKNGRRFHYFDFSFVPKLGWFCWFEIKEEERQRLDSGDN